MMKKIIISLLLLFCTNLIFAQGAGPGTEVAQPIDKEVWVLAVSFVVLAFSFIVRNKKIKTV